MCGRRPGHTTAFMCAHVCSVSVCVPLAPLSTLLLSTVRECVQCAQDPERKIAVSQPQHQSGHSHHPTLRDALFFIANPNHIPLP